MNFIDQVEMLEKARVEKAAQRKESLEYEFRRNSRAALTDGRDTFQLERARREDVKCLQEMFGGEGWHFVYNHSDYAFNRHIECRFNRPYTWLERLKARL